LKHVQQTSGEHPSITEEEYKILRANPGKDQLRAAYAAFTYSYNGKYFGGYVGSKERNYPAERKRYYNRLHDNTVFQEATIKQGSYTMYNSQNTKGALIYCDPPYEDTEGYRNEFNSGDFWDWARKMSKANIVLVSEYKAPSDFVCLGQHSKRQTVAAKTNKTRKRLESVFVHESLADQLEAVMEDLRKTYPCIQRNKTRRA
jgi:site-specific DNA-adenine methylase